MDNFKGLFQGLPKDRREMVDVFNMSIVGNTGVPWLRAFKNDDETN